VLQAVGGKRPAFRLYGKLLLTADGNKEYLATTEEDLLSYSECSEQLKQHSDEVPTLRLAHGHNTRQAMGYGFLKWQDFFNDRQLVALIMLRTAVLQIEHESTRNALFALFSGVLEFNNLFASYKGEGTGAVRHMFSHHILKPERTPIEANVWGTKKSSGSFSNLFRSRLLRAIDYRERPTEVNGTGSEEGRVCSPPFTGELAKWGAKLPRRGLALSCGDSATTGLPDKSIDFVVTDPPFFDNVHYSELADFFYAWNKQSEPAGTRRESEVQDGDAARFAAKLQAVLGECQRVLTDDGLLVFTYHHSRDEGWSSLGEAVLNAGFVFVNSHPVRAEMSVGTPKSQAKEPIQLDVILVCRKLGCATPPASPEQAVKSANAKLDRLEQAGFELSTNDRKIVYYGQLLTTIRDVDSLPALRAVVETELASARPHPPLPAPPSRAAQRNKRTGQRMLFQDS
jgi:putative DNA methylase